MTREEIRQLERHVESLYSDIDLIQEMSDDEVCKKYNVDSRDEILEVIEDEIDTCNRTLELHDEEYLERLYEDTLDEEQFRTRVCVSQGISRFT